MSISRQTIDELIIVVADALGVDARVDDEQFREVSKKIRTILGAPSDELRCPVCKNDDPKQFSFTDRPYAMRRVHSFEDDTLVVSADYAIDYKGEMGENEDLLWCNRCAHRFAPNCKIDTI